MMTSCLMIGILDNIFYKTPFTKDEIIRSVIGFTGIIILIKPDLFYGNNNIIETPKNFSPGARHFYPENFHFFKNKFALFAGLLKNQKPKKGRGYLRKSDEEKKEKNKSLISIILLLYFFKYYFYYHNIDIIWENRPVNQKYPDKKKEIDYVKNSFTYKMIFYSGKLFLLI